ncbi:MAG: hypothetical protein HQ592_15630 [Planctomycetes bacterium]|nr:hypothetical protein [Planctomycetota bacterium]
MDALKRCLLVWMVVVLAAWSARANPIPVPLPASMPLEDMYSELLEIDGDTGLRDHFQGDYYFSYIPKDLYMMKYPVPPNPDGSHIEDLRVSFGKLPDDWTFTPGSLPALHMLLPPVSPQPWYYIRELYPTVVPGWPGIPMLAWHGPINADATDDIIPPPPTFPPTALYRVNYEYNMRRWGRGWLYFYALGTGKYYSTYQKQAISFLDITMPKHLTMSRLSLDNTPHAFAVTCEGDKTVVSVYATAQFGPFTKDIIGVVVPWLVRADTNYDGSTNILDLLHVRNHLGSDVSGDEAEDADINGDGDVNILDLLLVRNHLGERAELVDECPAPMPGPQIRLRYRVKQCGTTQPPGIEPDVRPWGRRMIVTDQIHFNCCPEYVRMTILVGGNRVIFREKAIEKDPCDCLCYFPMKGVAGPFSPGTYNVELIDPYGRTILEKEIEIE